MNIKVTGFVLLIFVMFLSGCNGPTTTGCGKEGLVIVDYNVNPLERIFPGYTVNIDFWLQNKGEYDANNIDVNFFDLQEFSVEKLECGDESASGNNCHIDTIETYEDCYGDRKGVHANLRVPDETGKKTVSFSVNYNYRGYSALRFNIWDKGTSKEQWGSKNPTSSTAGPVEVVINSDFLLKRIVDDKTETITQWVEEGQKFTLEVSVRNHGSGEYEFNDLKLSFDYVRPYGECDFDPTTGNPKEEIKSPLEKPLLCDVEVKEINQKWVNGLIEAEYEYEYEIIKSQDFNIE